MSHLTVFVGFDSKEPATFGVAVHSILTRAARPVSIVPLVQPTLRASELYRRERNPNESTEFSLTRFLCPSLAEYQGLSLFLDSDVLVLTDIHEILLYRLVNPGKALYCCQHNYIPKAATKFDGHSQTKYQKKNWSSVMLFDNALCKSLTPDYVNSATGLQLHQMHWLREDQIGALPLEYNWLVGEYEPNPNAKILHYTNGAPCFADYRDSDHSGEWWREYAAMTAPARATEAALRLVSDRC